MTGFRKVVQVLMKFKFKCCPGMNEFNFNICNPKKFVLDYMSNIKKLKKLNQQQNFKFK